MPGAALRSAALFANSADDEAVSADAKTVFLGDLVPQLEQLVVLELEELVALGAVKVIVLGVAVVVLIHGPAVEHELAQESRIDELSERPIHRRAAYMPGLTRPGQLLHELIGVKMLVPREYMLHQCQPLLRHPHPAALQILNKPLARRKRDRNIA